VSYLLALKEPQAPVIPSMTQALPGTIIFPQFHLVTSVTEPDKANWRKVTRRQGQLINLKINDSPSPVDLSVMPFDQVRSMEADIVLDNNPSVVVGHLHADTADMEFKYHIDWNWAEKSARPGAGVALRYPRTIRPFLLAAPGDLVGLP